jgi:hypothetical protein
LLLLSGLAQDLLSIWANEPFSCLKSDFFEQYKCIRPLFKKLF